MKERVGVPQELPSSPLLTLCIIGGCHSDHPSVMEKLLTVVLVSSLLLLATLADHAASRSSSLHPSALDGRRGHVLGRKGREELACRHYRREGEHKEQHEVAAMEVERKEGGTDEDAGAATAEGLISSEDYSAVAMHDRGSTPAHKKHPKP